MPRLGLIALLLLSACGGKSASSGGDASATGGSSGGGGTPPSGGSGGSFGPDAAVCLPLGHGCDGVTPCCSDGNPCASGCECGIDPACVPAGSACGGVCAQCCSGQCANGVCVDQLECPMTIADYCAATPCITSWPSDPSAFCPILIDSVFVQVGTCNGYLVASDQGVDTAYDYYFDSATGALVAVVRRFQTYPSCLAGPTPFDDAMCSFDTKVDCSDAGAP